MVGEKVIAIGSPIEWETLEKTLTEGVAGKVENEIIRHDAVINGGNSGGPLLNYDGFVVGVNSFVTSNPEIAGPGLSGAVSIDKALPLIDQAKSLITEELYPSEDLLPDIPRVPYPISKLLIDSPYKLTKRTKPYFVNSNFFAMSVLTPPLGYWIVEAYDNRILKRRSKRAEKKNFEISQDEYAHKNLRKFYDYEKPTVRFQVTPKPKLTTASKVINTISFVAATGLTVASFGAGAPLMAVPFMMGEKEFKKDFLRMKLVEQETNKLACEPLLTGRTAYTPDYEFYTQYYHESLVDKSYVGFYDFDSKCFDTPAKLMLVIETEGDKKAETVKIPEKVKKAIVQDFQPYWDYVDSIAKVTNKAS